MRWWELFKQSMLGAARARLRSTLTSAGIAIGCGALVSMVAFALGLQHQLEQPFEKLGLLNDIHVSPQSGRSDEGDDESGEAEQTGAEENAQGANDPPPLLDEAAVKELAELPGVKYAYPEIRLSDVELARGDEEARASAVSLPREASLLNMVNELLVAGNYFSIDDAPEVLIGKKLVEKLGFESAGVAIDQVLALSAAGLSAEGGGQFQLEKKQIEVKIVGVFEAPGFAAFGPRGDGAVMLPVDVMLGLPGIVESQIHRFRRSDRTDYQGYGRVIVRVERPSQVFDVEKAIKQKGFRARTMLSELEDARTFFLFLESLLASVGTVALVVAGLGIANTLLMTVLERYQEIGVYKAIGASDGDVRMLFLFEASVLGLVGGVAGVILARVVCWGLQQGIHIYLRHEGVTRTVDVFAFPWWLVSGAVFFSIGMSVLSGLYPASRAARVDPIDALRRA